jgi:hypothetical protein
VLRAEAVKIIFLDIDGVLCTMRSHFAQGCPTPRGVMEALDREAVGLINFLALGVPDVEVRFVLISTWRVSYPPEWIKSHLKKYGFAGKFHDDWLTRLLKASDVSKGAEIKGWLSRHPEIEQWVIIDDRATILPEHEDRHVRPIYAEGLSWANFKAAAKILHDIEGLPE